MPVAHPAVHLANPLLLTLPLGEELTPPSTGAPEDLRATASWVVGASAESKNSTRLPPLRHRRGETVLRLPHQVSEPVLAPGLSGRHAHRDGGANHLLSALQRRLGYPLAYAAGDDEASPRGRCAA